MLHTCTCFQILWSICSISKNATQSFIPSQIMLFCIHFQFLNFFHIWEWDIVFVFKSFKTSFPSPRMSLCFQILFSISSSLPLCICSFCPVPTNYRCHSPEIPLHQKPDQSIFKPSRLQLYTQFKFCKNTNIIPAIVLFSVSTLILFQSI